MENVIKLTFEKWDVLEERFEKINKERRCHIFWPKVEDIEKMEADYKKWLYFLCYLYEYGEAPETEEETESKKRIQKFIDDHLELVD